MNTQSVSLIDHIKTSCDMLFDVFEDMESLSDAQLALALKEAGSPAAIDHILDIADDATVARVLRLAGGDSVTFLLDLAGDETLALIFKVADDDTLTRVLDIAGDDTLERVLAVASYDVVDRVIGNISSDAIGRILRISTADLAVRVLDIASDYTAVRVLGSIGGDTMARVLHIASPDVLARINFFLGLVIPIVPDLDKRMFFAAEAGALCMAPLHCGTGRSRAHQAIAWGGEAADILTGLLGWETAARLIYEASTGCIAPDFNESDDCAWADILLRADAQLSQVEPATA